MRFFLSNVIPLAMPELAGKPDRIWGSETTLTSPGIYLVKAPSGTGKSTLITYLYGIRKDFSGTIVFGDSGSVSLKQWSELRSRKISVVFQDLRLFPQLTALENIQLKNSFTKFKTEEEIIQLAGKLGIENKLKNKCADLSLGQQQRVAILRALCQPFEFLLLDEPFSHLDDDNIKLACDLINDECKKQNAGMLITSLGEKYYFEYTSILNI